MHTDTAHAELRAAKNLQRLWLVPLNIKGALETIPFCCSINENEWLVTDRNTSNFIHITGDGKIKAVCGYSSEPQCPCSFGSDILAVSNPNGINFHKF
jgi:hypothetical protein